MTEGAEVPRPEAPGPPPPPPQGGTSGFAIASLVLGILGIVLLSVIFGVIALRRIARRGQRGRGLAIAGLVLSGLWLLLIAVIVVVGVTGDPDRDPRGRVQEAGSASVFDVRVGDCVVNLEETDAEYSVDLVPCREPHQAEAISRFSLRAGDWPGLTQVTKRADAGCLRALEGVRGAGGLEAFYLHPTEDSWAQGDREVLCLAVSSSPRRGALPR